LPVNKWLDRVSGVPYGYGGVRVAAFGSGEKPVLRRPCSPFEVDDALTVSLSPAARIRSGNPRAPRRTEPMSSEPLTTTPVAEATDAAEKGLLLAVLLLVVLGTAAMLMMA
jgi:hypothetical protein